MQVAFHVSRVKGIQRISWSDISDPPPITSGNNPDVAGLSTGIVKIDGRIIIILDFEKIVSNINRDTGLDTSGLDTIKTATAAMSNKKLIVADDSKFLNKMITESLEQIGFKNINSFSNGQDAWDYICTFKDTDNAENITKDIACIISDIEMPKMDGHRLTKLVKSDDVLKSIPVVLFSSLINEQMIEKGKSVGADAQFSKPQIKELIDYLVNLLS
jgi:two-component system chemotaxis response regulator CheV